MSDTIVPQAVVVAYAAGFFDGEGCVRLQANQNGKQSLRVYIAQKDVRPLEYLQPFFGGLIRKYKSNVAWQLQLFGLAGYEFLVAVEPFLIVKRAQAQLAIRAFENGMTDEIALELSRMKRELV